MEKITFKEADSKLADAVKKIGDAATEFSKNTQGVINAIKRLEEETNTPDKWYENFLYRFRAKGYKSVEPHRPPRRKRKRRANWEHKIDKFDSDKKVCKIEFCKMYALSGGKYVKMKPLI